MIWLYIIGGVCAALAALWLFLFLPGRPAERQREVFGGRYFAHRGLYDNDAGVPENSLAAFKNAARHGYGCELDVQFTKDKKLIVFHDNDFKRASGVDTPVWELTYDEVQRLPLFGSDERAPLFSEVLRCMDGRAPLIVEIKAEGVDTAWYREVFEATKKELKGYKGEYCIESFHPYVVRLVKKHMPQVLRGQLVGGVRDRGALKKPVALALAWLLTSFYTRPQFIAYDERYIGRPLRAAKRLGAMSVMWTVRTLERCRELEKTEGAIIFEHCDPGVRFTGRKEGSD